jgi:hypothetical protein
MVKSKYLYIKSLNDVLVIIILDLLQVDVDLVAVRVELIDLLLRLLVLLVHLCFNAVALVVLLGVLAQGGELIVQAPDQEGQDLQWGVDVY